MLSYVLGWGIPLAYLAITLFTARTLLLRWKKNPNSVMNPNYGEFDSEDKAFVMLGAMGLGMCWPAIGPWMLLMVWLWKPIERHEAKLAQLRADRERWMAQRNDSSRDSAEYKTADDIIRTLDDLIKVHEGK